jgi:hypothetical protein
MASLRLQRHETLPEWNYTIKPQLRACSCVIPKHELVDLAAAWKKAVLSQRRELCQMLFPDGLVWSQSWGFLNPN